MSTKKDSYRIFVNDTGHEVVEHEVLGPCLMFRTIKDEVWFIPWDAITSVRIDPEMLKIIKRKQQEAAQAQQEAAQAQPKPPELAVPSKGIILPGEFSGPRG